MNIFITNDDGYNSKGIRELYDILVKNSHNVFEIAPFVNQSAKSHSVLIHGSIELLKNDENIYSLSGSPADSVIFYYKRFHESFKADLIISGINKGLNISSDIIYSGTCAAAREGSLFNIPSIAISQEIADGAFECDYKVGCEYLVNNLEKFRNLLIKCRPLPYFLNINVPLNADITKAEEGSISFLQYQNTVEHKKDNEYLIDYSKSRCAEKGEYNYDFASFVSNADYDLIRRGIISLTFISALSQTKKMLS